VVAAVDLAHRFKDLREQAGLTRTGLARPRYTVSYVSQIESGRRKPSPEALGYFAGRLGVTADFLATGVPENLEDSLRYQLEEARAAVREGRAQEAQRTIEPVVNQAGQYGLDRLRAEALVVRGDAMVHAGNMRDAIDAYEEALEGDLPEREQGLAIAALARGYRDVGDLSYAVDLIEAHEARRDRPPLDPAVAGALQSTLVSIYFERGDILRAELTARRALLAADRDAPIDVKARAYWNASRVLAEAKRWDEALDCATRARILMEELDDRRNVARLHNAYAFICLEAEPPRLEEAASHLDRAEDVLATSGSEWDLAYLYDEKSRLALLQEEPEEALRCVELALPKAGEDKLMVARLLFHRGVALAALERREDAQVALREAAVLFGNQGARQQEAACWRELGEMELSGGDVEGAVRALRAGLEALDPRRSRA
jgi:tetratricopeptide (TPR) repeat protein